MTYHTEFYHVNYHCNHIFYLEKLHISNKCLLFIDKCARNSTALQSYVFVVVAAAVVVLIAAIIIILII